MIRREIVALYTCLDQGPGDNSGSLWCVGPVLDPLLRRLHDNATARDKAGNRTLHYDHYAALNLGGT